MVKQNVEEDDNQVIPGDRIYNANKYRDIMNITQSNYANMINRLKRREKVSSFALIYYSVFTIILSLTVAFYPNNFDMNLSNYLGIVLSIIMLVYSIINNNANYSTRILKIEKSLNKVKSIKREINDNNLNEKKDEYDNVVKFTEIREDTDFFLTVKQLCKENRISWVTKRPIKCKERSKCNKNDCIHKVNDICVVINDNEIFKKINNYLSEIRRGFQQIKIIAELLWYLVLFIGPIAIILLCVK